MKSILLLIVLSVNMLSAKCQRFVESSDVERAYLISYAGSGGTAFIILHNNKNYWVTAKHIFEKPNDSLRIRSRVSFKTQKNSTWVTISGRILIHSNPKVDIAVIPFEDTGKIIVRSISPDAPLTLGGDGFFVGFPFSLSQKMEGRDFPLALVKKFSISGFRTKDSVSKLYLDGHNNPGFSGGPVFIWHPGNIQDGRPYFVGVISGYLPQNNVVPSVAGSIGYHENSGIIVAIDKKHIFEILKQNGID